MKKIFTMLILAVGLMTSCQDYLDINKSPNSPSAENMTPDMMFPAVEMNLAASYGDFLRIVGGYYSQHYSQLTGTSNYLDYSQFNMSATRSSGTYTQLNTRVLGNLKTIRDYAAANEEWGTYLAATVLRAFTYQVLVDCYEQVPYTEAMNTAYPSPKYDDGLTVYQGVIAEIDDALAKASESDLVCSNFLFPSAGAQEWVRFANALKLKMYMRISGVADVQSAVDALVAEGNFLHQMWLGWDAGLMRVARLIHISQKSSDRILQFRRMFLLIWHSRVQCLLIMMLDLQHSLIQARTETTPVRFPERTSRSVQAIMGQDTGAVQL